MVDENEARIAELERENAELNVELGREARIAGLATVTMHEQYAKLARLQAVVRAAKPVIEVRGICYSPESIRDCWCSTCEFDVAFEELLPDDLKGVK